MILVNQSITCPKRKTRKNGIICGLAGAFADNN